MARVAEDLGATIALDDDVQEILFKGRLAVGVRRDPVFTRPMRGDQRRLCSCHDPARARPSPPPLERPEHRPQEILCSTFMLYLGIEGRYTSGPPHHLPRQRLPGEPPGHRVATHPFPGSVPFYPSLLAPPGKSTLYLLLPVTNQHPNVDWTRECWHSSPRWD